MSTLQTNLITNAVGSPLLKSSGSIIQTARVRSDSRTVYSASGAAGNGTTITDLNITISPRNSNSLLIITWHIFFEADEDTCFLVHEDGALITTAGYTGYNSVGGNNLRSALQVAPYDAANNNDSTPHMQKLVYYATAGSTASRTYAPAVRSSSGVTNTFTLNRCIANAGADAYEVGVSFGRIFEVSQ